ncbi:MAG: flagellar hook-associated protein FlgL [Planctomycetota bacterium]|jgi:flagellar hook-associated protein 3 FlgL
MSATLNNIYNNVSFALHLHAEAMARLQEQASTGSRINRASDDPSAAYQILGLNSQEKSLANYMDNLSEVVNTLELSSITIDDMTSSLVDVQLRLTQIMSDIYDEEAKERAAEGINNILEQMVLLANTKHMGQYIFGGSDTASAPYLAERTNGEIINVSYQGSFQDRDIEVAPGVQSSAFYIGDNIFRSDSRGTPVFLGNTGAAAGTGTSSVRGDVWLTVTDEGGGNWTLSIDGGTAVNSDGTQTNLAVKNPSGQVLYVDTTGITSAGVDMVSVSGTHDIFNMLITIRDVLNNERGLSDAQLKELQNKLSNTLDEVSNLLVQAQVVVGSEIGFLDNLKDSLKNRKFNTEDEATRLQEADIAQIAIDLSRREVLYQMSLSVAARLMSMSLLDFLR